MSLRQILYIFFHHKWLIIVPTVAAPVLTVVVLLFVEPVHVSSCKLWVKEREEGSKLLKVPRPGLQETTFAEVQQEIITSHRVIEKVVSRMGLEVPPPSNSILARYLKIGKSPKPSEDSDEALNEAMRTLRKNISVSIVNPEVIRLSLSMNEPGLAQKTLQKWLDAYREEYLQILTNETTEYRKFLDQQLGELDQLARKSERMLVDFEVAHPEVIGSPGETPFSSIRGTPAGFVSRLGDMSPVPTILQDLAKLEMERNREATSFGETSDTIKKLDEQIRSNKKLLKKYTNRLSAQAMIAVEHERLRWALFEARRHYSELSTEYYNVLVSQGTKVKQVTNIAVLNKPDFNIVAESPKKRAAVVAGLILGILAGAALTYLANFLDRSYHLPEEVAEDLDLPVLTAVKLEEEDAPPAENKG